MKAGRAVVRIVACGLMMSAIAACAPVNQATSVSTNVAAKQPLRLTLGFNSDAEITVVDPRGKTLHFGADVPEWRNDFGGTAEFALAAGRPQVHIVHASSGTWRIGVGVKSELRVLSLQGFTDRGCPVDDNIGPVKQGFTYWWSMRVKLSTAADTCAATLTRAAPVKL